MIFYVINKSYKNPIKRGETLKWKPEYEWSYHATICQRFPYGAPTPPPEIPIEGGCPDYWYPYKNRCFRFYAIGGDELENRVNWENANNKCKQEGGTLAILPEESYDLFVFSMMSGKI